MMPLKKDSITAFVLMMMLLLHTAAFADEKLLYDSKTINGYSLDQFPNFQRDWHFVTVRYRKDTGELRLIYANDLAYETLLKQPVDYPDGAIFGKIAFQTGEDPDFPSSAIPYGIKRYQFMVRNKAKHS